MNLPTFPPERVRAVAAQAMAYPYRLWGFGEDIALRGLLEIGEVLADPSPRRFVHDLLADWCAQRGPLGAKDHVAPGLPLLLSYDATGHPSLLQAARDLGDLLARAPRPQGVPVHRPDLSPWEDTIWVDCMYGDGPFLLALWRVTGEERWLDLGVRHAERYTQVLQDPSTGLFRHGYDTRARTPVGGVWARGNGWALLGLVEVLALLPADHPSHAPLQRAFVRQVEALVDRQHPSGAWPTLLTEPESPLENSTAALYAAGLLQARRQGNLGAGAPTAARLERAVVRALEHLARSLRPDGGLSVSAATPIGDRATYVDAPSGVFPWGQGPALLAIAESTRSDFRNRPAT